MTTDSVFRATDSDFDDYGFRVPRLQIPCLLLQIPPVIHRPCLQAIRLQIPCDENELHRAPNISFLTGFLPVKVVILMENG